MGTMLLKLVLSEQYVKKLLICLFMSCLDPLFELRNVKVVLLCLKWSLQRYIQNPIMLVTASANEVHSFTCL